MCSGWGGELEVPSHREEITEDMVYVLRRFVEEAIPTSVLFTYTIRKSIINLARGLLREWDSHNES